MMACFLFLTLFPFFFCSLSRFLGGYLSKCFFTLCQPFCVCVIFCCRVAVPVTTDTAHTWIIIIIIVSI